MRFPETLEEIGPGQNDIICKDIPSWGREWYQSILPENNKLSLKFEKWDDEFKGKLRSKMVPILGYGGTKKSLLALNIAFENISRNLGNCIYSTMEMGATEIINRLIDIVTTPNDGFNAHYELEYHNNKTKRINAGKFFDTSIAPIFKDKFFLTENTSMDVEKYDRLIDQKKQEGKKIDILVVDGLSGMGGSGSETELYSRHSKELKDLSNKWKMMTILICHVSKGGKKTDRDLSRLIRSSEKIIDNSDFYITASLFDNGDGEYNKNHGALRLINKRGSGNTLDVVYEFNKLRLTMDQTEFDFSHFEI